MTDSPVNRDREALLELAACPRCRGSLETVEAELECSNCRHRYALEGGVPALFAEEERGTAKLGALSRLRHALLANHRVYDFAQRHGGGRPLAERVSAELGDTAGETVVDVGAGTGTIAALLPPEARYVWVDNDRLKLRGLVSNGVECVAVLGDAARLPLRDEAGAVSVMMEVSHHLPDDGLRSALSESARVTRERFVFLDALSSPRATSRFLWALDLGRHPRTESQLLEHLAQHFVVERVEHFRVHHEHILCVCRPRRTAT